MFIFQLTAFKEKKVETDNTTPKQKNLTEPVTIKQFEMYKSSLPTQPLQSEFSKQYNTHKIKTQEDVQKFFHKYDLDKTFDQIYTQILQQMVKKNTDFFTNSGNDLGTIALQQAMDDKQKQDIAAAKEKDKGIVEKGRKDD